MLLGVVNPLWKWDGYLMLCIGIQVYINEWPDLTEWFERISKEETRFCAYLYRIQIFIDSKDFHKLSDCIRRVQEESNYIGMSHIADSTFAMVQGALSPAEVEFCKSVFWPFLLKLIDIPPTSYWRKTEVEMSAEQKDRERWMELARNSAYSGFVKTSYPETFSVMKRAVLDDRLPVRPSRIGAFKALVGERRERGRVVAGIMQVLAEHPELPIEVRVSGYESVCQMWSSPCEGGILLRQDPEFDEKKAQFGSLLRNDMNRNGYEFTQWMVKPAYECIVIFDKSLALAIMDAAAAGAADEQGRKYFESIKVELEARK
jgi:hypothetical protein